MAHAESLGAERLYTLDDRIINMSDNVTVKLMKPPGIHGPLFDSTPEAPAQKKRRSKP